MTHDYANILDDMVACARAAGALTLEHFKRFRDLEIDVNICGTHHGLDV